MSFSSTWTMKTGTARMTHHFQPLLVKQAVMCTKEVHHPEIVCVAQRFQMGKNQKGTEIPHLDHLTHRQLVLRIKAGFDRKSLQLFVGKKLNQSTIK
jgi:hypothetical protein